MLHYISFTFHSAAQLTFNWKFVEKYFMLLVVTNFPCGFVLFARKQILLVKMRVVFSCWKHVAVGRLATIYIIDTAFVVIHVCVNACMFLLFSGRSKKNLQNLIGYHGIR